MIVISCPTVCLSVEAEVDGAEGGVVEAGLLPVPKKPPRGFKTDATKLRMGGGQVWQDHSLEDWDPSKQWEGGGELYVTKIV